MADYEITRFANGYSFKSGINQAEVYLSVDDLLSRILLALEGRAPSFTGSAYGRVIVEREPPNTPRGALDAG